MAAEEIIHGCITGHLYNALDHQGGKTPEDALALFEGQGTITFIPVDASLVEALVALDQALPVVYADASVPGGNTIGNSVALTAFASQYTVPADTLRVGTVLRVTARGVISATGAPTLGLAFRIGGTQVIATGAAAIGTVTNQGWSMQVEVVVIALGISGTAEVQGEARTPTTTTDGRWLGMPSTAAATVDSTVDNVLDLTAQWSAAAAGNTLTLRSLIVEVLNQPA